MIYKTKSQFWNPFFTSYQVRVFWISYILKYLFSFFNSYRLPFKCSLGGDCNIELPKSELIVHEKEECRFRKITCVAFCGAKVPFINFVKHMESHCRPKAFKPPICLSFSYKMGESLSDYKPIDLREIKERFSCSLHAFDKQFYLQGIRSCGFTIFFMYFFGLKKDAKFWYSLEFTDAENQEILCWKKKVIPIDIPLEEIFKSKTSMCLEMTDGMMRNFVKSDKYHFKIQITSNNNTVAPNSTSGGSEQN